MTSTKRTLVPLSALALAMAAWIAPCDAMGSVASMMSWTEAGRPRARSRGYDHGMTMAARASARSSARSISA